MATLTATQITQLNNSMEAAQRIGLGTRLAVLESITSASSTIPGRVVTSGCRVITIAEISASLVVFSASSYGLSAINGFIIAPFRTGSAMMGVRASQSASAVTIIPAQAAGSYIPVVNDALNYILF